jgi:hypothetical protein
MILAFQSFLKNLGQTIESIVRIILLSRIKVKSPCEIKKNDQVVILGNGPSLQHDLNTYPHFLPGKDLICVNHFPKTELFEAIQPSIFITGAPDLWLDDIEEKYVKQSKELFEAMNKKTNWPLSFFIPFEAKKHSRWQNQISGNSNITIFFYNNIPVEGWNFFKNWCFKRNIGMPRPHNVMIPSLMMSLALGYETIYLLGADHSWLPEISVTDTNEVLINQKHFYDHDTSKGQPLDKRGIGKRTLPELLYKFMTAFSSYFEIRRYADYREIKILNATKDSFIDAFDRIKLKEITNGKKAF